ncbi:hypothetical protein [Rhodococcus opacus]|uniref:hypothetical protein n=1 Tax=Rhodococcus opacus TaxID=37919 RepID=UPI0013DC0CE8|nr:hypothetical protein [Rhodococcus opacus]MDV7090191.1 hypothetical protein [Rhodococcus opacus]
MPSAPTSRSSTPCARSSFANRVRIASHLLAGAGHACPHRPGGGVPELGRVILPRPQDAPYVVQSVRLRGENVIECVEHTGHLVGAEQVNQPASADQSVIIDDNLEDSLRIQSERRWCRD